MLNLESSKNRNKIKTKSIIYNAISINAAHKQPYQLL